jgi:parallel beta-helix repeat protein
MALSSWHKPKRSWENADAPPGRSRIRPRCVLRLEALENRTVPSSLFVSPTGSFNGQPAFKTIQAAVNAAVAGDTVNVAKATYNENVTIPVAVNLLGAEKGINPNAGTRSDPANESIVTGTLSVTTSDVSINGFTIRNPSGDGIFVADGVGKSQIVDEILQGNRVGLLLHRDTGTSVSDDLIENSVGPNVDVVGGTGDDFERNTIEAAGVGGPSAEDGMDVEQGSSGIKIEHNVISVNTGAGLSLSQTSSDTVSANTLSGSKVDIGVVQANANTIESNIIVNAVTDGIELGNSSGNKIENNTVTGNGTGGQGQGILLSTVTSTTVSGNTVSNNMTNGIEVAVTSSGVSISTNTVGSNGGDGIALSATSSSQVAGNTITGNANGIHLLGSDNNQIHGNSIQHSKNDGIWMNADSAGNKVTTNVASGSGGFDAEDDSNGSGTAGTANSWIGNTFGTDNKGGGLRH